MLSQCSLELLLKWYVTACCNASWMGSIWEWEMKTEAEVTAGMAGDMSCIQSVGGPWLEDHSSSNSSHWIYEVSGPKIACHRVYRGLHEGPGLQRSSSTADTRGILNWKRTTEERLFDRSEEEGLSSQKFNLLWILNFNRPTVQGLLRFASLSMSAKEDHIFFGNVTMGIKAYSQECDVPLSCKGSVSLKPIRNVHFPNDIVFQDYVRTGELERIGRFIQTRRVTLDTIYHSGKALWNQNPNLQTEQMQIYYANDFGVSEVIDKYWQKPSIVQFNNCPVLTWWHFLLPHAHRHGCHPWGSPLWEPGVREAAD